MADRLPVPKTYKLYIGGAFPRSESGRSEPIRAADGAVLGHACLASRKDLRDAVVAARKALGAWSSATAYNRGQILYRMAEMLEGKRAEMIELLTLAGGDLAADEVAVAVDRLVAYAGWADKFAQVLGCQNPVAGPYWNITTPEPTGVIGVVCPSDRALLGLVSLVAPVICAGNTAVVVSSAAPSVVSTFGEVCATSDLPPGVVNLLTGRVEELVPVLAAHRDVDGVHAAGVSSELSRIIREGTADNLKRTKVHTAPDWFSPGVCEGPWWIEPFVELKTAWHPVGP
jgi:acyl-CoA reductase-like NAD-dependent aldehyde dehydrogenase